MSIDFGSFSRHVLLPTSSLKAWYYTLSHKLTLHAEGEAHTSIHDIQFIRVPDPSGKLVYLLKAWATALQIMTPYEHTESFRELQPNPLRVTIVTEGGPQEVDIELVWDTNEEQSQFAARAPTKAFDVVQLAPATVTAPLTNENNVVTMISSKFTVKEAIKGGSVNIFYDRDYLDLLGAAFREDTIYYEFQALKFGRTEVVVFRSGGELPRIDRIVDVTILSPLLDGGDEVGNFLSIVNGIFDSIKAKYADAKFLSVNAYPTIAIPVHDVSRLNNFKVLCSATNDKGETGTVTAYSTGGAPPYAIDFGPPIVGLDSIEMPPTKLIDPEKAQEVVWKEAPNVPFFSLDLVKPMVKDPIQPRYEFHMANEVTISVGAIDGKLLA